MAILDLEDRNGFLVFNEAQCRDEGAARAEGYAAAHPFPHIVLDDFIDPAHLRRVQAEFPDAGQKAYYNRTQEKLKYQYGPGEWQGPATHNLFAALNSQAFLEFLENLTGIEALIVDPGYNGGGLHETRRGGKLGIHADFNIHKKLKVIRRLNLLIYLNEDWQPDYGGSLELWNKKMETCEVSVAPEIGRAVIFSTELDSYHGHPDALTCPPEISRRSMALYYYTAASDGLDMLPNRTTNFKVRPGHDDKVDWAVRRRHFINDWVPPAVRRYLGFRRHLERSKNPG